MVGVLGAALVLLLLTVVNLVQSNVDPRQQFVSDLAHGRLGTLLNVSFLLGALVMLVLAFGLARMVHSGPELRTATLLVAVAAFAFATLSVVPTDPYRSRVTWRGEVHAVVSTVGFVALLGALVFYTLAFRRDDRWLGYTRRSGVFAMATLAAIVPLSPVHEVPLLAWSKPPMPIRGLAERAAIAVSLAWLIVTSIRLWGLAAGQRTAPDIQVEAFHSRRVRGRARLMRTPGLRTRPLTHPRARRARSRPHVRPYQEHNRSDAPAPVAADDG